MGALDSLPPPSSSPLDALAPPSKPGVASRFGSGLYSTTLAPIVHILTTNPIDTVTAMFKGAIGAEDLKAIKAAAQHGDYKSAAILTGHYLTQNPATRVADAMTQDVEKSVREGDYAGAAGKIAGDAISIGIPVAQENGTLGRMAESAGNVAEAAGQGVKAAAPDIAIGAAKAGGGMLAAEHLPPIVREVVGIPSVYTGGRQILKGLKKGIDAYSKTRDSQAVPTTVDGPPLGLPPGPITPPPPSGDASFVHGEAQEWSGALGRWVPRGTAPPLLSAAPEAPEITATAELPDPKAVADMMRDLPAGAPKAIAKANYAGNQESAQAGAVYEAAGRAEKAQNLATMFHDEGLPSKTIANWDLKTLNDAARDRGMKTPFSMKSFGELVQQLRQMESAK